MTTAVKPPPPHGKRARYLRGCRCAACCAAHKRYCKEYDLRRHRNGPRNHDGAAAAEHLRAYVAAGWAQPALAEATSVPYSVIRDLIYRPNHKTSADNIRRILAFQPPPDAPPANYWTHPAGTIRRIQALAAVGHPVYVVAAAVDAGESTLRRIIGGDRQHVSRDLAGRVAALYDQWSHQPGPSPYTRGTAAARGWRDPQFWEDTGRIDDPDFDPDAPPPRRHTALAEDGMELERLGHTREQAAARLGVARKYLDTCYSRWRKDKAAAAAVDPDSEAAA